MMSETHRFKRNTPHTVQLNLSLFFELTMENGNNWINQSLFFLFFFLLFYGMGGGSFVVWRCATVSFVSMRLFHPPPTHTHTRRGKNDMAIYFVDLPLYLSFDLLWPRNWVNVAIGLRLVFFPPDGFYFWFLLPLHPPCRYSIPDYFSCVFQGVHLISPSLTGFAGVPIKREYTRARSFSFGQKREFHNEDLRRWWASWSVRLLGRWGHYRFLPRCVCVLCVCEGVPLCSERWGCEGLLPSSNLCGTAGHGRARLDWRVEVDEYFQPQRWVRVFFSPFFFLERRVFSQLCVLRCVSSLCVRRVCARAPVCLSLSLFPPLFVV